MYLCKMHIPLDQGVIEPKGVMMTIRGGGELLLTVSIKQKPSSSGWPVTPVLCCCGCRRTVHGPTPLSGCSAMSTTSAHGTTNGNACAMWSRMWSSLCRSTAHGGTIYPRYIRLQKSRLLSSAGRLRHKPRSPHECMNLLWTDLEGCSLFLYL